MLYPEFPNTFWSFKNASMFVRKRVALPPIGLLTGTRLLHEDRLLGSSCSDNLNGTTNFMPKMDLLVLRDRYRNLMTTLYAPAPYCHRVRTFLRELQSPKMSSRLDPKALAAFMRSAVRLSLIGRERFQYWKLLAWTSCQRPRMLPMAVKLAIHGHHLRR